MTQSGDENDSGGERGTLATVSRCEETTTTGRLRTLLHPLFLGALAALAVNDHLLKGAGILPGAVTGKLSDFAGLVVAPVLGATIVEALFEGGAPRARRADVTRRGLAGSSRAVIARAAVFAGVAALFAAIKLSAAAAGVLVEAGALVGLTLRIWQDPTDLVGLLALAPAWWLLSQRRNAQTVFSSPKATWVAERAALAGAAAACVATSQTATGGYRTPTYLVNSSGHAVDVRVRWVDAKVDCVEILNGNPGRMLGPSAFDLGITFRLVDGATVPLDRQAAWAASGHSAGGDGGGGAGGDSGFGADPGESPAGCDVALLEMDDVPATLVFWPDLPAQTVATNAGDDKLFWETPELETGRVQVALGTFLTPGKVKQTPLLRAVEPSDCSDGPQVAYQWSVPAEATKTPVYLHEVGSLPDGCVDLLMGYQPSDGDDLAPDMTAYLCIPDGEFPFTKGQRVTLTEAERFLRIEEVTTSKRLEILQGFAEYEISGLKATAQLGACDGDRLECGAYASPAALSISAGGTTTLLRAGEAVSGKDHHVRVGRVERVSVGRDVCETGYQVPSLTADFILTYQ